MEAAVPGGAQAGLPAGIGPGRAPEDDASALLADVSHLLASEAEPDRALTLVLRRLVPELADWGTVRLAEPDGHIRRVAAVHADPGRRHLVDELLAAERLKPADADDAVRVMATGRARVFDEVDDAVIERLAAPGVRALWRALGVRSAAVIPMAAGGKVLGAMILVMGDSGRRFDRMRVRLAEGLAVQCALLVDNTRLVREADVATHERVSVRGLLDTVLAHAPVATAILDHELRLLHANEAFTAIVPGAALGSTPPDLASAPPGLADAVVPVAREVLEGGVAVDRAVVRSDPGSDGRRTYWQVSAFPIDRGAGERFGVGLFLSDVTEDRLVSRRLTESLARLDLSLAVGGLASWDWDFATRQIVWSGTLDEVLGLPAAAFGRDPDAFLEVIHPEDREPHRRAVTEAARSAGEYHNEVRVVRADGELRWVEIRGRVMHDPAGNPRRMIGVAADITDRRLIEEIKVRLLDREHQARVEAEEARERFALVAEASATLVSTLDPQATFEHIPAVVVPRLCDWCIVDALDEDGSLRQVAMAHRDPAQVGDVEDSRRRRLEAGGDGIWSVRRAVRTGASELVLDISDGDLVAAAADDEHLALLRRLGPRSAMVVPLVARGRVLGGITLVTTHDRRFRPDDLPLVENLAGRAAMAVDNALLFESRSTVARALQQTLLPPALPRIPHVDVVARYRVAQGGIDIGGDFYDLFELTDGSWAVVIGDVCGKGPGAAAVTGLFRHTVRAVASRGPSPANILRSTNEAILGQIDDTRFCTAAFVRLEPRPGGARATVACGGHPRPMVVHADGRVERLDASGTLLGVLPEPVLSDLTLDLVEGDAIVLYTDGVTEARRGVELFGEDRLVDVLAEAGAGGGFSAARLADHLEQAVDRFQAGVANDDIAILVLRVGEPTGDTGARLVDPTVRPPLDR